jgi:tetratricopeptide (TPR) repeat protein
MLPGSGDDGISKSAFVLSAKCIMKSPTHWALDLYSKLPARTWAWVIVAFAQDPNLWDSLSNPDFYRRASGILQENPQKMTPARLGLLSCNPNIELDSLKNVPKSAFPPIIRYKLEKFNPSIDNQPDSGNKKLKWAFFCALKLNQESKTLNIGTWLEEQSLKLLQSSRLVLACLLEFVPEPIGLLQYIIEKSSRAVEFDTILQAFFSLPQDPAVQLRSIRLIIQGLSDQKKIDFVRSLARQRPGLAVQVTRETKDFLSSDIIYPEDELFKSLITKKLEIDLNHLSNLTEDYVSSLGEAIQLAKKVQGHISARLAQHLAASSSDSTCNCQKASLEAWKNAMRTDPMEPLFLAGILNHLIGNNQIEEAKAWIDSFRGEINHPTILLQSAKIYNSEENFTQAIDQALGAQSGYMKVPPEFRTGFLLELSSLLGKLGQFDKASQALEAIIEEHPVDADYLGLLSKIQADLDFGQEAFDSAILAYAAYLLSERDTQKSIQIKDHQLLFIEALEAEDQWSQAYKERSTWIDNHPDPSGMELAGYAKTALNTDQAGISLNLLNRAINLGVANEYILELLGITYHKLGNLTKAIEYLEKSCQLAPHRETSWLYLADVQSQNSQPENSIETLRAGALAVPDSPKILLKLGEFSVLHNAPTQAIIPLQKAASLIGLDGSQPQPKGILTKKKEQDHLVSDIACSLANALRTVGKTQESQLVLEKSLQQVAGEIQNHPDLFAAYAASLKDNGDYDHAIPMLERLLELDRENFEVYLSLCQSFLGVPEQPAGAQQALPLLKTILEKSSEPNQVYLAETLLAETLFRVGNFEEAKNYYQKSLRSQYSKSPNRRGKLTFGLGQVNFALNEVEAALAAFQEAIRLSPENSEINRWLAETYLAVHLYEEAFSTAQQQIQRTPVSEEIMLWFTEFTIRIKNQSGTKQENIIQETIRLLLRYIQNGIEKPALWLRLGELHLLDKDIQAAFAAFGRILDLSASTIQEQFAKLSFLFTAGKLLLEQAAYPESIVFLEPAALLGTELNVKQAGSESLDESEILAIDIFNHLEKAYLATGNLEPSIEMLQKIIGLDPCNPEPYIRLAERLHSLGLIQEAISCLEKALDLQPENFTLFDNIIWIYSRAGDLISALNYAEKAYRKAELSQDQAKNSMFRYLAAEISRSIFATNQATEYLVGQVYTPPDEISSNIAFLKAEINFEANMDAPTVTDLAWLDQTNAHHPRLFALKARISLDRLSPIQVDLLTSELKQNLEPVQAAQGFGNAYADWGKIALHRSLAEAAICLGDWQGCFDQLDVLIASSPYEPLANLQYARSLVMRAESQRYADLVDIVNKAPGVKALQDDTYHLFLTTIEKALRRLSDFSVDLPPDLLDRTNNQNTQKTIFHWRDRGILAFQPSPQNIAAFREQAETDADKGALLLAFNAIDDGNISQIISWAKNNNLLDIYISLALEQTRPWEALETICQIYEKVNDPSSMDHAKLPIVNFLLSRLSMRTGGHNRLGIHPITALERALQEYPDEPRWHALVAQILLNTNNPAQGPIFIDKARQHLETAIELEPANAYHHLALGKLLLNQGQATRAADCFHKASRLDPELGDAWLALANIQFLEGELENAANSATQAIENTQDPVDALVLRGKIALSTGNPRGAQSRAQSALKLIPNHLEAQQLLARSLNALDQSEEAIEIMAKVIPQVEKPLPLEIERSRWLSESSPTQEAALELRSLAQRYPQEPLFKALLAEVLLKLGQMEPALLSARQALQDSDLGLSVEDQSRLYFILGHHYRENGQLDSAIHQLNQAIERNPGNLDAHLELGRTHQDRREYALAVSAYQGGMQVAGSDYRPYYMAGIALKEAKEYQAAEEMLQKAVEKSPDNPIVHRQLGAVIALNLVHNRRSTSYPVKTI